MRRIFSNDFFDDLFQVKIEALKRLLPGYLLWYGLPILLMVISLLLSNYAAAAEVKVTPKITVGGSYDDNVLFSSTNKISSPIVNVRPRLDVDYKTLLSTYALEADVNVLRYLDESDLDRTNQYYKLSGDNQIKERWNTSFDLSYRQDTTLNTYLQETGQAVQRSQRDYFQGSGEVSYRLSEINGISLGYRYQNASYEQKSFSDYYSHSGGIYFNHHLKDQVDTISFGPGYYYRKSDVDEVDAISINTRWKRDWSPITHSDARLGVRYTKVKPFDGPDGDTWGGVARLDITFQGLASTTLFRYFHDLGTTVNGDDVNVDNFYLRYRRSITERLSAGIDGRLVFNYKLLNQQSGINDSRYYRISPVISYRLTQYLGISLSYRYQNSVTYLDTGNETIESNAVSIQLHSSWPMMM